MSEESSTDPPPSIGITSYLGSSLLSTANESAATEPSGEEKIGVLEYYLSLYAFEETASALGKLSIEFQFLETEIRKAIGFLINRSDEWIGKIVTGGMAFGSLVDLLRCLFEYEEYGKEGASEDEATFSAFLEIERRCRKYARRRNDLVHSLWYPDLNGAKGASTYFLTRKGQKMQSNIQGVAKADVLKIADEIKSCRNDLNNFWKSTFP